MAATGLGSSSPYKSGNQVSQFSMKIANADRSFGNTAAVTISFTPSNQITATASDSYITLFFPARMFKNLPCTGYSCPFTYKSSVSGAYLRTYTNSLTVSCNGNLCYHVISNGVQSISPTGATIPANVPFTITISGAVLGSPQGNTANSVFVTTSADPAASEAVDSGIIGLGSYINGSCPYGLTWSNADQACTSCSTTFSSGSSVSITSLICSDFDECLACVACPLAQAVSMSNYLNSIIGPPATIFYYACSDSASKCPAGSGKQLGENGGCIPCPFDMYNDGSFATCQYCLSGTYPQYTIMTAPVQVACTVATSAASSGGVPSSDSYTGCSSSYSSVQTGYVMRKSASSCSSQCAAGTGVLSDTQSESGGTRSPLLLSSILGALSSRLRFLWGATGGSVSSIGLTMTPKSGKGCAPCLNWFISKDNTCQSCNQGANDRATLNSLGNTFSFAIGCVFDICPWPYVPVGMFAMNELYSHSGNSPAPLNYLDVCNNVHLGGTIVTITLIAIILFGTYAASISFGVMGEDEALTSIRRRKIVVTMLLTTVSPAVDFVSDIMYIVSTLFYSGFLCIIACFFFLLPTFFFWRMLTKHGVHFGFYIGKPPAFAIMENYDSIPKALLGLVGYLPLYIINLPISLPLFLLGHMLYCCKVFPISRVSNLWLRLYTRSTKHTSSVVIIVPLLQLSIFEEMLTESVPQMIIQIINNTLTNVWSPLSYFSTAMSGIMILNGIWRLVYYRLYLKIAIDAIPTDLSDQIFKFSSIEEGTHSIGRVPEVKPAQTLELNRIGSEAEGFSDELSPLIQRHISASIAELRAEMENQKADILSELRREAAAQEERLKQDVIDCRVVELRAEAEQQRLELLSEIKKQTATQEERQILDLQLYAADLQLKESNQRAERLEEQLQSLSSRTDSV
jgi:hypothetical protein